MFHLVMSVFVFMLFFLLTPGILVQLPPNGSKITVALTHALVFTALWTLLHKSVWKLSLKYERS